jgi:DNA-binding NarL/FixJ family response regulator
VRNLLDRNQMVMDWRGLAATMAMDQTQTSSFGDPNLKDPRGDLSGSARSQVQADLLDLTPREKDVIVLLGNGLSNPQIGEKLHLSARTIEKYVSSLFRKTDTTNRAELLRYAIEHHLL